MNARSNGRADTEEGKMTTTTHYTPKWKDQNGNVMIFPARNTLFDSHSDAMDWALSQFIWMVPFGLSTDGVLEFEAEDGKADILHRAADYGMLGSCCIIAGPDGPAALKEPRR